MVMTWKVVNSRLESDGDDYESSETLDCKVMGMTWKVVNSRLESNGDDLESSEH